MFKDFIEMVRSYFESTDTNSLFVIEQINDVLEDNGCPRIELVNVYIISIPYHFRLEAGWDDDMAVRTFRSISEAIIFMEGLEATGDDYVAFEIGLYFGIDREALIAQITENYPT